MRRMPDSPKSATPLTGRPLAIDPKAESASASKPAFIARPIGTPVYHGFQALDDVVIEGFTLGKITDFEAESSSHGDAFVIAPDDSRAGLVWEISDSPYFRPVCPLEPDRWGVWEVSFPFRMDSRENASRNLAFILPQLKEKWDEWQRSFKT